MLLNSEHKKMYSSRKISYSFNDDDVLISYMNSSYELLFFILFTLHCTQLPDATNVYNIKKIMYFPSVFIKIGFMY